MQLCDYGCGKEAIHQFKNGKWCCSKTTNGCPEMKKINSFRNKGKVSPMKGKTISKKHKEILSIANKEKTISEEHKKKISKSKKGICLSKEHKKKLSDSHKGKIPWNKGKTDIYLPETLEKFKLAKLGKKLTTKHKKKIGLKVKGEKHYLYNKSLSIITKKKISKSNRYNISTIKKKYPTFSKIEEMRYNPDKPDEKEIQVHCKNHLCENSKEQDGWFTPINREYIFRRILAIEKTDGNDGAYFYCSTKCRIKCPLFNLRTDPFKVIKKLYTSEEYQMFRQQVLNREDYLCEYCGEQANTVHHIMPQKLEPWHVLDLDYGVACCTKCHYKYGHKNECSTGIIANQICK